MDQSSNLDKQAPGFFQAVAGFGTFAAVGSAFYEESGQTYLLKGPSGEDVAAGLHLFREMAGDFILCVRVRGSAETGRCGLLAFSATGARRVELSVDGGAKAVVSVEGGTSEGLGEAGCDVLQIERAGGLVVFSVARFGEDFVRLERQLEVGEDVFRVGLFVGTGAEARFGEVRLTVPAWDGLVQYTDYLGSRLELLDVETGEREIVYSTKDGIEAPNWTPDGRALIYNSGGRLYRFDLGAGVVEELDTGFAVRNNNDHVLSWGGEMIAISHHAEEHAGKSIVYKLPVGGGEPVQLTPRGPSYLHGWSPDNRYVIYTAERNGTYDIWRTTTDGVGEEMQLTATEGLDDGSEYSPDGAYIYFNSTRSGLMQIWRMKADGSEPEQVTDDGFNNWFPHVSPDGRILVFLSYGQDVEPAKHPYYKRVTLRAMPVGGGAPSVVAYLYGGQGTINVPSWSHDGRRVAFVSHTVLNA